MKSNSLANIIAAALLFILITLDATVPGSSAASLHQDGKKRSWWFSDCRGGSKKMGLITSNCEGAAAGLPTERDWSQRRLRSQQSPPPSPLHSPYRHHDKPAAPPPVIAY